jgi:hypothetical protein
VVWLVHEELSRDWKICTPTPTGPNTHDAGVIRLHGENKSTHTDGDIPIYFASRDDKSFFEEALQIF